MSNFPLKINQWRAKNYTSADVPTKHNSMGWFIRDLRPLCSVPETASTNPRGPRSPVWKPMCYSKKALPCCLVFLNVYIRSCMGNRIDLKVWYKRVKLKYGAQEKPFFSWRSFEQKVSPYQPALALTSKISLHHIRQNGRKWMTISFSAPFLNNNLRN